MKPPSGVTGWIATAFGMAFVSAAAVLAVHGAQKDGVLEALRLTARIAFLFFWPSYAGGALAALLGNGLAAVKRRAGALGLAFAAVMTVHLGLIARLCWIGAAPSVAIFVIFGLGIAWTAVLVLYSNAGLRERLRPEASWTLRHIGPNYVLFAFGYDFLRPPPGPETFGRLIQYLPFTVLVVAGPLLRLAAWIKRRADGRQASFPPAAL